MAELVLLVEDEMFALELLTMYLERAGYRVSGATTATEALASFKKSVPDIVLLDLGLPDEDGLVVVRKLRAVSEVPIIVLSARADNSSRTSALKLGANDYVTKGVVPQELLMRMSNLLSKEPHSPDQVDNASSRGSDQRSVQFSGWTLNIDTYALTNPNGEKVALSASEYMMLSALAKNKGRIVNRATLVEAISGVTNGPTERNLDTYINRLRKKIELDPKAPKIIQTLRGVGYILSV